MLPPMVQSQSLGLRVATVATSSIELESIEKHPTGLPMRKLTIPVDLRPVVHYRMQGQPNEKASRTKIDASKTTLAQQFGGELFSEASVTDSAHTPQPSSEEPLVAPGSNATVPGPTDVPS